MITLEEKEGYLHANHDLAKAKTLNLKTSQNYALICQIVKGPEERSPSISKIKPCERGIVFFRAIIILRGKRPRERERAPLAK